MLEIDRYIPAENYFVGLLFDEGYWFVRLQRKQQTTKYAPYWFEDGDAIAVNAVSGWEVPTDSEGRKYLEPQEEGDLYQYFIGLTPSSAKLYLDYTEREDRMNLISPREVPGDIGYWDGEGTPYRDPSPETELWAVQDIWPSFNAENPGIAGESIKIGAAFYITNFSYEVIKDKDKILSFLRGQKRCTVRTMGDPDRPIKAPAWMLQNFKRYMVLPAEV